jgi:integrase/recombinase XerD
MAKEGKADVLTKEEHEFFLTFLEQGRHPMRDKTMYLLGIRSGLRIGSICQLRVKDCYEPSGKVKKVSNLSSSIVKGSRPYRAYFNHPELISQLEQYRPMCGDLNDFMFLSQKHQPFTPNNASRLFFNHFKQAGFTGKTSHSMRRTYASWAVRKGIDIVMLKNLMNHSNIAITAEYVATDDALLMDAVANF